MIFPHRAARLAPLLAPLLTVLLAVLLVLPSPRAGAAPTSPLRFAPLRALGPEAQSVLSLLQDRQGFIWIGTQSAGLFRFNGYQAVPYLNHPANPNSLPHDRVSALFQDGQGRIWAGTQNGLARFNPERDDFTRFVPPGAAGSELIIKAIVGDGAGGMWLATWGGLQHFDPDHGRFVRYRHDPARPESLATNDLNALALDRRGGLWAATWPGGLDYLAPGGRAFLHYRIDRAGSPASKHNIVRALHAGADGRLWIGTEDGVVLWDRARPWEERRDLPSPPSRVTDFLPDGGGGMWAATLSGGMLHYPAGGAAPVLFRHRASDPYSLPSNAVRALLRDRAGMMWVATFSDGIALANLNSTGFTRLIPFDEDSDPAVPSNTVSAMAAAPDGTLWLAGHTGVAQFDPATGAVGASYRASPGVPGALAHDIVYSLYQQAGGPLWIGTSAGLNRMDRPGGPLATIHFDNVVANYINTIAPAADGSLWLGTGAEVLHYDPRSGATTTYRHDPAAPDSRGVTGTTTILDDGHGRVWMGSEWNGGGLDLLDVKSGRFRHFRHRSGDPDALSDDNVTMIYRDPDARLWAATDKGINEVLVGADGEVRFRRFGEASVGTSRVLAMRSDAEGKLWVSTNTGLVRLDTRSGKVERFEASDGLTDGFAVGAVAAAADGTLYFGGVKGITAVHPGQVRKRAVAPQVAITDVSVFNRSLKHGRAGGGVMLTGSVTAPRALLLSGQASVFAIEFAALHYTDPARNRYAYRLAGFDRDWVETDARHRSATYTNLDPGQYRFEVKAANDEQQWTPEPATLAITILPPWWATRWFRVLFIAMLGAVLATLYRVRMRRLTSHQARLERQVAERTRELEESNAKLAALSTTDPLTNIGNRRSFDVALAAEWRRARRNGHPLALAMLDVDHFKAYNDHYGHQAGDGCLRAVAGVLAAHARRTGDMVARYGGEEFVLLAPATSGAQILALAQDVCRALEALGLPHARSPYGVVTISVGVAVADPRSGGTAAQLLQEADRALYRAKEGGRNRAGE